MRQIIKEVIDKFILNEISYGYHSGDLGKSHGDGLYGTSTSRHTGHFGSGTYFFGKREDAEKYGHSEGRPVHEIDFDKYNLLRIKNQRQGIALHDFLKEINNFYIHFDNHMPTSQEYYDTVKNDIERLRKKYLPYGLRSKVKKEDLYHVVKYLKRYEPTERQYWGHYRYNEDIVNNLIWRTKDYSICDILDEVFDNMQNALKELLLNIHRKEEIEEKAQMEMPMILKRTPEEIINALYDARDYARSHNFKRDFKDWIKQGKKDYLIYSNIDSASTFFMKQLGYDGIDVRGIDELDNGMYGSVIYDI